MRVRHWSAATCLVALCAAATVSADPQGHYVSLTPFGGYTLFDGTLRYPRQSSIRDGADIGARLGWAWLPWLGVEAVGGFSPSREDSGGAHVNYLHGSANLMLTPAPGLRGGPYAFVGFGGARFSTDLPEDQVNSDVAVPNASFNTGNLEWGGGLRFWVTDLFGLRLEARNLHWLRNTDKPLRMNNVIVGAGLTYALGARARDSDHDGVPDRIDQCPNTPLGARVDARGCPLDSDKDAVYDGLDRCPNTPAGCKVDANGCPIDSDGDGVCDGVDACPDTPKGAVVDAKGCPVDSDDDGVADGIDTCPNTPKGCTVDAKGCPIDSDGDGVCDGIDQCPNTGAGLKVDAKGCPIEVLEKETELMDTGMIRLEDIHFETDKWDVLPADTLRLTEVGAVLRNWPTLEIEIGGHTDSRGSAKHNQVLSEKRAGSVKSYLVTRFPDLSGSRFTVKGYGATRPIVPNTSVTNMARNRRVEFVVKNREVLRREVQRRRLLKSTETPGAPGITPAPTDTLTIPPSPAPPDTTKP